MRFKTSFFFIWVVVQSKSLLSLDSSSRNTRWAKPIKSFSTFLVASLVSFSPMCSRMESLNANAQGEYINTARSFYDAWNIKDVEKAIKYFSNDIVFSDAQYSEPFLGLPEVKKVNIWANLIT